MNNKILDFTGEMGIHTVEVKFMSKQNIDVIKRLDITHDNKVTEGKADQCKVVLDFSRGRLNIEAVEGSHLRDDIIEIDGEYYKVFCEPYTEPKELSTISEVVEGVDLFSSIFALGETVSCTRVDIAYDLKLILDDNLKLFMNFIEMFNLAIKGKGMYRTEKNLFETGNLKCSSTKKSITTYDETDKESRAGYLRLEYRETGIRNSYDIKKILKNSFAKYSTVLGDIIKNYKTYKQKIQKNHVDFINKFREKQMKKSNYIDFKSFVNCLEAYDKILTRETLKELYELSECSGKFTKWMENYRNTEVIIDDETGKKSKLEINFVSEQASLDLLRSIRKKVKSTLNKG